MAASSQISPNFLKRLSYIKKYGLRPVFSKNAPNISLCMDTPNTSKPIQGSSRSLIT